VYNIFNQTWMDSAMEEIARLMSDEAFFEFASKIQLQLVEIAIKDKESTAYDLKWPQFILSECERRRTL
jgi:hypothetical protein